MASTTQTWTNIGTVPTLSGLAAGDDVTIAGPFASLSRGRALIRDAKSGNGKTFTQKVTGPQTINIKRVL